jgi:hypothetical protein
MQTVVLWKTVNLTFSKLSRSIWVPLCGVNFLQTIHLIAVLINGDALQIGHRRVLANMWFGSAQSRISSNSSLHRLPAKYSGNECPSQSHLWHFWLVLHRGSWRGLRDHATELAEYETIECLELVTLDRRLTLSASSFNPVSLVSIFALICLEKTANGPTVDMSLETCRTAIAQILVYRHRIPDCATGDRRQGTATSHSVSQKMALSLLNCPFYPQLDDSGFFWDALRCECAGVFGTLAVRVLRRMIIQRDPQQAT